MRYVRRDHNAPAVEAVVRFQLLPGTVFNGVGADGLILLRIQKAEPAEVGFRVFNADGSEAEISGSLSTR